jgi:hypothetical protein
MLDPQLRTWCAPANRQKRALIASNSGDRKGLRNSKRTVKQIIPTIEYLEDRNLLSTASPGVFVLSGATPDATGPGGLPAGFNPAQIRHAYGFDQISFQNRTTAGDGSGQTIAIIDAYSQPHIASDLAAFDATFGIAPPPSFSVVNEQGGSSLPAAVASWGLEESLDVEWAHAVAPGANIVLVEASSSSVLDLLSAVNYARNLPGVSVVSMSFGGGEWSGESSYDSYFTTPAGHSGVTFIASSGDSGSAGAPEWPSVSPNVLAVGGTQLSTDANGDYQGEVGWSGSGGGISLYETQPYFQSSAITSTSRTVPDVAYDGSSGSPFAIYDTSTYSGWLEVYGTSCGSPQWAGLVAIADQGRVLASKAPLDGPSELLPAIYAASASDFHDITSGSNGGFSAGPGYDLVTGRGSPVANLVVSSLVGPVAAPLKSTLTSIASNVNPSVFGQPIRLTAQVFAIGGGSPTGEVAFMEGNTILGEGTINYGFADFTTNSLPPGDPGISAVYLGDSNYAGSNSFSVFQFVMPDATIVSLTSSANPAQAGQAVSFTSIVSPVAPGGGTPTGIVYFLLGSSVIGQAPVTDGVAVLAVSSLPVGNGRILASYSGDGNFFGASSAPLTETINPAVAQSSGAGAASNSTPGSRSQPAVVGDNLTPSISNVDGGPLASLVPAGISAGLGMAQSAANARISGPLSIANDSYAAPVPLTPAAAGVLPGWTTAPHQPLDHGSESWLALSAMTSRTRVSDAVFASATGDDSADGGSWAGGQELYFLPDQDSLDVSE